MADLKKQTLQLLDFSQKLDINLLDDVVNCMYTGTGDPQKVAQDTLTTLKQHPDAWTKVDTILEYSNNQQTKYYALQILENLIESRWRVLPRNQCDGIKNYIVSLIIKTSSDLETSVQEKVYLTKLNMILVQILKREWPKNWPSFIPDIVGSSKTNESLCQNNMLVLKLLSEEVFDFSAGRMTQAKAKQLKDSMCSEFALIFQLCIFVTTNSQSAPLVKTTLETLLRFLNWIPLGYIFETELINTLIFKFLSIPMFRNVTLMCLTEIAGVINPKYEKQYVLLFKQTMAQLVEILPTDTNIKMAYTNGQDAEQNFILNLSMFLSTFLKAHAHLIEQEKELHEILMAAYSYLLLITEVDETEIFKICLEYWNSFASGLYLNYTPTVVNITKYKSAIPSRRKFYERIVTKIRYVMIDRMVKPEEVLVVENEQGDVVREFMKDTDAINIYKTMRETLVFTTHLDSKDTQQIMTTKMCNQVNGSDWSWKKLNSLCWAIGSISGTMDVEEEKKFLVTILKELIKFCGNTDERNDRAIVASTVMYIVGQYPRFLKENPLFLHTVVEKLFEFMREKHDGVQDMACDTFIKITEKCKREFDVDEVNDIVIKMCKTVSDLNPIQMRTMYEAVGHLISSQNDAAIRDLLLDKCMYLPNQAWDATINRAKREIDILKDADIVKQLVNMLKANGRLCKVLKHSFVTQLSRIYSDMFNIYNAMSENINNAILLNGDNVVKQPLIKTMRSVKKEIIKLTSSWIYLSNDNQLVLDTYIPPLLNAVLLDYHEAAPLVREPEVLSVFVTIVDKLQTSIIPEIGRVFENVFECTLNMINKDFEEFPEHRSQFYLLLQAVNEHCFSIFLNMAPAQFKLVLDAIFWAFKHTMREVADIGLNILNQMMRKMFQDESAAQSFYQTYYTDILQHVFSVATDTSHTGALTMHAAILAYMFSIVESGKVSVSLNPDDLSNGSGNVSYIQDYVATLLKGAFPHLTDAQIKITVQGLFDLNENIIAFKNHLRDVLVEIKEFAGEDDSDLFLEEREADLRLAQEEKRRFQISVPGILNPHEISEEMQE